MASVHIANLAPGMDFLFNIGAPVGKSQINHRLDVLLVQYLLNMSLLTPGKTRESAGSYVYEGKTVQMEKGRIDQWELPRNLQLSGHADDDTLKAIASYKAFRSSHWETFNSGNVSGDVNVRLSDDKSTIVAPWKYPTQFRITGDWKLDDHSQGVQTMIALSYDAARSSDFASGKFSQMPAELRKILLAA